jgi:hypothetical protein
MRTNPLFLKNERLAAATNLTFEEGVIRTRPGFRYESLGASGQFQGSCEYRPQEGISSSSFSEVEEGIAVVADGVLWFQCNPVSQRIFDGVGSVHLYQAENYLIVQNPQTDTFWWDGEGELVRSPGMQEQDWNDPEVPTQELEIEAPVATLPDCDVSDGESGIEVRFLVIDNETEQPIEDVVWTVKRNGTRAYHGLTGTDGRFSFKPRPRVYAYDLRKDGYIAIEDIPLEINGTGVERSWDECLPPTVEIVGEYDFVVRMFPVDFVPLCEVEISNASFEELAGDPVAYTGQFTVTNTGNISVVLNGLTGSLAVLNTTPTLPVTLEPQDILNVALQVESSLEGLSLDLDVSCLEEPVSVVFPTIEPLEVELTFAVYGDLVLTTEIVTLNGSVESGIFTGTCSKGDITLAWNGSAWRISFDSPTPASGTGVLPNHEPLGGGSGDINDPDGYYLELGGAPFPNWLANIPPLPP